MRTKKFSEEKFLHSTSSDLLIHNYTHISVLVAYVMANPRCSSYRAPTENRLFSVSFCGYGVITGGRDVREGMSNRIIARRVGFRIQSDAWRK